MSPIEATLSGWISHPKPAMSKPGTGPDLS